MSIDPYSTHLPLLLRAVAATTGPVLELGMGEGSTPILHEICRTMGRRLVSYDTDSKFVDLYAQRYPDQEPEDGHSIFQVYRDEWERADIDHPWSVVLIDHRPARRRRHDALRLANLAEYIVCHDTEPEIDRFYRYSTIFSKFKFVLHSEEVPRTSVLSNLRSSL
jgi:hypothetical protein